MMVFGLMIHLTACTSHHLPTPQTTSASQRFTNAKQRGNTTDLPDPRVGFGDQIVDPVVFVNGLV